MRLIFAQRRVIRFDIMLLFLECHGCSPVVVVVVVSTGLEDSTTGSVAETVASVLRGCLESMPKGESTTERMFMESVIR